MKAAAATAPEEEGITGVLCVGPRPVNVFVFSAMEIITHLERKFREAFSTPIPCRAS